MLIDYNTPVSPCITHINSIQCERFEKYQRCHDHKLESNAQFILESTKMYDDSNWDFRWNEQPLKLDNPISFKSNQIYCEKWCAQWWMEGTNTMGDFQKLIVDSLEKSHFVEIGEIEFRAIHTQRIKVHQTTWIWITKKRFGCVHYLAKFVTLSQEQREWTHTHKKKTKEKKAKTIIIWVHSYHMIITTYCHSLLRRIFVLFHSLVFCEFSRLIPISISRCMFTLIFYWYTKFRTRILEYQRNLAWNWL